MDAKRDAAGRDRTARRLARIEASALRAFAHAAVARGEFACDVAHERAHAFDIASVDVREPRIAQEVVASDIRAAGRGGRKASFHEISRELSDGAASLLQEVRDLGRAGVAASAEAFDRGVELGEAEALEDAASRAVDLREVRNLGHAFAARGAVEIAYESCAIVVEQDQRERGTGEVRFERGDIECERLERFVARGPFEIEGGAVTAEVAIEDEFDALLIFRTLTEYEGERPAHGRAIVEAREFERAKRIDALRRRDRDAREACGSQKSEQRVLHG
jgi:hypothetical protein